MAFSIVNNTASLSAMHALRSTGRSMSTTMQRLSTGLRVNTAADDAAGLAISNRLTSQIRGTEQALRNVLDAQSLIQVAEGGYHGVEAALQRMRELSVAAANGALTDTERSYLNLEASALKTQVDSIATSTNWNGTKLLDGSVPTLNFQAGANEGSTLSLDLSSVTSSGLGLNGTTEVGSNFEIAAGGLPGSQEVPTPPNDNRAPSVTYLEAGNFVVTWDAVATGQGTVWGQVYSAQGDKTGEPFVVNTFDVNSQMQNETAPLAGGGFITTWSSSLGDGSSWGVFAQVFDAQGTKVGTQFQVNTYTLGDQFGSTVTGLSDGGYAITWQSENQDGDALGVFGQVFDKSGDKVGTEFQVNADSSGNQRIFARAVTAISSGGFYATWTSDNSDIWGQRFDSSGNSVGDVVSLATNSYGGSFTELSNGDFVFTRESGQGTFVQRIDVNGNKLGDEVQVTWPSVTDQSTSIVALKDGGFFISWAGREDQGLNEIWLQRYDADGSPVGDPIQANTFSDGLQSFTSMSVSNTGDLVVVWQSDGQNGVTSGIYGQRYSTGVSLSTQSAANAAIDQLDRALTTISTNAASFGAFSNRLMYAADNLVNSSANQTMARSRILDTDYAQETTNLARDTIVNSAATAMLSQANMSSKQVMTLLDAWR